MKSTLSQPIGVVFFTLGKIFRFAIFFIFIFYLLSNTKFLIGYTLNQTLIFYLVYNIVDTISQFLFREVYRFRPLVVNGELDSILIKPYHPFMRILIGGIDIMDCALFFPYFGLLIYMIFQTPHISVINILTSVSLIINAFIIATAFHILVLAFGIVSTEVDHTILIYRDISKMGAFPVDIYKEPLRSVLTFIIPIGIMITFPAKALFGLLSIPMILLCFGISFTMLFISLWSWNKALQRYQSWGG
jgi:ABC-2 type transport system permease protein